MNETPFLGTAFVTLILASLFVGMALGIQVVHYTATGEVNEKWVETVLSFSLLVFSSALMIALFGIVIRVSGSRATKALI